jgi:Tol biopolymer transport system component
VDPSSGVADYAFSRDGSLVYVTHEQVPPSTLVSLDRDGTSRVLSDGRRFGSPRFSTDGNRVLVTIQDELGQLSYWIYDLIRDTLTLITSEEGQNTAAIWTPDDARITFGAHLHEDGRTELHSKAADGSGQAEKLTSIEIAWAWPTSWSPDGNTLAVTHLQPDGNLDISLLILDGTPSVVPFTQTHYWEMHAMFSSDGRWLSYTSDESGRSEVYVRPYPGPGEKVQISTNGGGSPVWSRDGRELFYMDGNRMMAVPIEPGSTLVAGQPIQISEGDYENQACCINYDVSPDAASLVMVKREPSREIHVVLNWFEELKRLVPKN